MKRLLATLLCLVLAVGQVEATSITTTGAGVKASAGGGGCSQATAFLARTSGLNGTHTTAYTTFICGLVTDGLWTKFDGLYVLATADTTTAALNLVSTSYGLTASGSIAFTADTGSKSTGGCYDTGFNPTTAGSPNFVQNSAHMSAYSLTNAAETGPAIGSSNTNNAIYIKYNTGVTYVNINDSAGLTTVAVPTSTIGQFVIARASSSATVWYQSGTALSTQSPDTSAASPNADIDVLGTNACANTDPTHVVAMASFGSNLTSTDTANFATRSCAYLTAVHGSC